MAISRKARKELSWALLLVSCLCFSYYLLYGEGGYLKLREYQEELRHLKSENAQLRISHEQLRNDIDRLRTDPFEIERIAREKYNLARPGDIIVIIPE